MSNLLRADFFRLWRSKSFWACMMFQVGSALFFPIMNYIRGVKNGFSIIPDWNLFAGMAFICVLSALFATLFVGTDYSDGTIRNQLVVGHRRREIYLSHLITCITGCLLMCAGYLLPYLLVSRPLLGPLQRDAWTILVYVGVALVLTVALASLYTMLAMVIPNRTVSAVVALVLSFGLLLSGSYLYSYLNYPPTYTQMIYNPVLEEWEEKEAPYPFYLKGTKRDVFQLLCDVNPGGQIMQCNALDAPNLPLLPVYSAALTVVTTGAGLWGFRRKDLN